MRYALEARLEERLGPQLRQVFNGSFFRRTRFEQMLKRVRRCTSVKSRSILFFFITPRCQMPSYCKRVYIRICCAPRNLIVQRHSPTRDMLTLEVKISRRKFFESLSHCMFRMRFQSECTRNIKSCLSCRILEHGLLEHNHSKTALVRIFFSLQNPLHIKEESYNNVQNDDGQKYEI